MLAMFKIVQGIITKIMEASGFTGSQNITLPQSMIDTIESCGFWESIPLWAVTLIGSMLVWVLSFVMILTVYGRFFKMFIYVAVAPIPLATFGGEELYKTKEEKAASLGFSLISNHAFVDGNKRIGVYVMLTFLEAEGIKMNCTNADVVKFGLSVASGDMKYDAILDWINKFKK